MDQRGRVAPAADTPRTGAALADRGAPGTGPWRQDMPDPGAGEAVSGEAP